MRKTAGSDVLKEESLLGPLAVSCLGSHSVIHSLVSDQFHGQLETLLECAQAILKLELLTRLGFDVQINKNINTYGAG